jgi:hypothetical protein
MREQLLWPSRSNPLDFEELLLTLRALMPSVKLEINLNIKCSKHDWLNHLVLDF